MSEKVTGYILLAIGLMVIAVSAINVYQVFTKKASPVEVFNFDGIALDATSLLPTETLPTMPNSDTPKMELISKEMINQTSNLFIHLFLMGFVTSVGYKIASLGVMMLRPIVVPLKQKYETGTNDQQ